MTPTEMYRAGGLRGALDAQIQEVKVAPADNGKRLFLFELCSFAGEWDRAKRQIEAVNYSEPELAAAVASYRKLIDAEEARRRTFREAVMPQFLVAPPPWVYHRLEAIRLLAVGKLEEAAQAIAASNAEGGSVQAIVNGHQCADLCDCDDRFGPILEVMAHGDYYWLPMCQVETITARPPKFPRDLIWFPAKISVKDGPAGDVFIPTRYPGTTDSEDDQLRLARATHWVGQGGPVCGIGLRLLLVGEEALPLPELREWTSIQP